MTKIIRWNPYRGMYDLINSVDRVVDSRYLAPRLARNSAPAWGLALDVAESEDEYLVEASLPGIDPENLDITIESNVLAIKGEYKEETESEGRRYHMRERRTGSFCRSLSLPNSVDSTAIEATYEAGVLTLHLPKAEEAKPQRIDVKNVEQTLIKDKN